MLAHATQSRPTDLVCRAFCAEVVTRLNRAGFVISNGDIALWLLTSIGDASSGEPGPQHRIGLGAGLANRIPTWMRRG